MTVLSIQSAKKIFSYPKFLTFDHRKDVTRRDKRESILAKFPIFKIEGASRNKGCFKSSASGYIKNCTKGLQKWINTCILQ